MRNGGKKGSVPYIPAYLDLIQLRRDDLRDKAAGALQMQGIEESERDNLERALKLLGSIDELVKIIGESPCAHVQKAHALVHLWSAIGAVFIIGSRGIKNPITEKFLKDSVAGARSAKPRIKERDQINAVVARHVADCHAKNPLRKKTKSGTATDILEGVNADLVKLRIEPPLKHYGLLKRINF
jgi:hypothetical protein